jgi:hypothetical protein
MNHALRCSKCNMEWPADQMRPGIAGAEAIGQPVPGSVVVAA